MDIGKEMFDKALNFLNYRYGQEKAAHAGTGGIVK